MGDEERREKRWEIRGGEERREKRWEIRSGEEREERRDGKGRERRVRGEAKGGGGGQKEAKTSGIS